MGSLDFSVSAPISTSVQAHVRMADVVNNIDRAVACGMSGHGRALAKLAADAVALANDWDRGAATRADVIARAEALSAGYREVM